MSQRFLAIIVLVVAAFAASFGYQTLVQRMARKQQIAAIQQVAIPAPQLQRMEEAPVDLSEGEGSPGVESAHSSSKPVVIKPEVNWTVPFTSQAPLEVWDAVHEEACEEASALMVLRYFDDRLIHSPSEAEKALQGLLKKNEDLGFPVDDTVQQVAALLASQNRSLRISVKAHPTEQMMKEELSKGHLIIVPAYGRALGNPYYQSPGPVYHMLVLRGYTRDGYIITNDPGTKRGEAYPYSWDVLIAAIHDWNGGNVEQGEKAVIVIGQYKILKGQVGGKK